MSKNKKTLSKYSIIIDDIKWSHSSLTTYQRCPKCFYLQYIKCLPSSSGFYGEYGSFIHNTLEMYAKNQLELFELSKYYKNNFDQEVKSLAPPNKYVDLKEKYYLAGLEFFNSFEGYDDLNIIGVENKYDFKIDKYNFTGLIDLETEDIIDYKTKGELHLLRLTKKHDPSQYVTMIDGRFIKFEDIVQLLLYCIPYKNKHGKYPNNIILDMVKINDKYVVKFSEDLLNRAIDWALDLIFRIKVEKDFNVGNDLSSYWCNNTCSQRYNCPNSERYVGD
jgi:hypothetical protein